MNQNDGSRILSMIGQQLQSQFCVEQLDRQWAVTTPMMYPDNTPIELGIELTEHRRAILTDYGEAAGYAFVHGVDEATIRERIAITVMRFGLSGTGSGELALDVPEGRIVEAIFKLATAVQDIAYLVYSARSAHAPETLKLAAERY